MTILCWLPAYSTFKVDIPRRHSWGQRNIVITLNSSKNIKQHQLIIFGSQKSLVETKNSHKKQKPRNQAISWIELRSNKVNQAPVSWTLDQQYPPALTHKASKKALIVLSDWTVQICLKNLWSRFSSNYAKLYAERVSILMKTWQSNWSLLNYVPYVFSFPTGVVLYALSCLKCLVPHMISYHSCLVPYVLSYFTASRVSCASCLTSSRASCLHCSPALSALVLDLACVSRALVPHMPCAFYMLMCLMYPVPYMLSCLT